MDSSHVASSSPIAAELEVAVFASMSLDSSMHVHVIIERVLVLETLAANLTDESLQMSLSVRLSHMPA